MQNIRLPGPQQALDLGLSIQADSDVASQLDVNVKLQLHRASTLLTRLGETLLLVCHLTFEEALLTTRKQMGSILRLRCLHTLQENSDAVRNITQLGREDNALILRLTEKSARDADVLKNLTVLASIYLPAMFVAVISVFIQPFVEAQISSTLCADLGLTSG